jgi:hypothetical protein
VVEIKRPEVLSYRFIQQIIEISLFLDSSCLPFANNQNCSLFM